MFSGKEPCKFTDSGCAHDLIPSTNRTGYKVLYPTEVSYENMQSLLRAEKKPIDLFYISDNI